MRSEEIEFQNLNYIARRMEEAAEHISLEDYTLKLSDNIMIIPFRLLMDNSFVFLLNSFKYRI